MLHNTEPKMERLETKKKNDFFFASWDNDWLITHSAAFIFGLF